MNSPGQNAGGSPNGTTSLVTGTSTVAVTVRFPLFTAVSFFASSALWAVRLVTGPGPWTADAAALIAVDLLVLTAVALAGMLVAGGRWARRLAVAVAGAGAALAVALPADGLWTAALAFSAGAVVGLVGTGMKGVVRERPAAAGPPTAAVVLPLVLLTVPGLVGTSRPDGLGSADWTVAAVAVLTAGVYAKAAPGALLLSRVVAPVALVAGGILGGLPGGAVAVAAGVAVAAVAWTPAVRVAVRPLVEPGSRVLIPAELTPAEILDAAGLDERGRPRSTSA